MMLDIVAVIIGILYTVRKLDVRRHEREEFPHVPAADFERWRRLEAGAYSLGSVACFAKVLLDYGFVFCARRVAVPPNVIRVAGAILFFAWVAVLIVVFVRASAGRKLRSELGIDLSPPPPASPGTSGSSGS